MQNVGDATEVGRLESWEKRYCKFHLERCIKSHFKKKIEQTQERSSAGEAKDAKVGGVSTGLAA